MPRSSSRVLPPGLSNPSQEIIFDAPDTPFLAGPSPGEGEKGHRRNASAIDSVANPAEDATPLLQRNGNDLKSVPYTTHDNLDFSTLNPDVHRSALEDFANYHWRRSFQQYIFPKSDAAQYAVADWSPMLSDFLKSPPLTSGLAPDPNGTPKQHPFTKRFEPPNWRRLAIHTGLCGLAYPFVLIFVIFAQERSLFWTRFLVSVGCGVSGALLGWSLLELARGIFEATTWATLIHQSRVPREAGVRLKDLAAQCDDPYSAATALRLLWDRHHYPGADIEYRRDYDPRRWSVFILFFLTNVVLAVVLPFLFGRIVNIEVRVMHQYDRYYEVAVRGDLSEADIQRANNLQAAFESFLLTWTLTPFSMHGGLPEVVSFPYGNDSVYFSEVILSQLLPNGSGFGTFETNMTAPSINLDSNLLVEQGDPTTGVEPGSLLRFPRWGIRIKCAKIPDAQVNIITFSQNNYTYLFTPRDTIQPLFSAFDLSFPPVLEQPLNVTAILQMNDTLPTTLNTSQMALGAVFWDNGVAHSMKSTPVNLGQDGTGFVTMENILVRLNSSYAPNGVFSTRRTQTIPDENGNVTFIGYDAAVCLELYEPWVLETYNSSVGSPTSMRIVEKSAEIHDVVSWERMEGKGLDDPSVKIQLNSTGILPVYIAGHQNSVNQILKDNGRDSNYVPSPTLISFTSGQGPYGYTELSEVLYAKARALADASNVLPYFAGSALSLARSYRDQVIATAFIRSLEMAIVIASVFLMGVLSALFVPRLPLGAPRRGFDLYSWISAFYAHELIPERSSGISKNMELDEMRKNLGEVKFRYTR